MYEWFNRSDLHTVSELRKYYRDLLKQYHPDNGGNVEIMQEINAEYDAVFADLSRYEDSDGQTYTCEENAHFKAILNEIAACNMDIEIIGSWIWAFQCYPYRDKLKALGFKYAPKKKAWVWHEGECRHYSKKDMSLSSIRAKYGSQKVKRQSYQYLLNSR